MNTTKTENSLDCSSGCESGWTMYFENSSVSSYESSKRNGILDCEEKKLSKDEKEDEDLSLISDASSGPPHYVEMYMNSINYNAPPVDAGFRKKSGKIKKTKGNDCKCKKVVLDQQTLLDDTATSAVFNFSDNNFTDSNNYASAGNFLEISEGYPATQFEVRTGYDQYQGHYDSCYSSISGKYLQQNQLFQEKR